MKRAFSMFLLLVFGAFTAPAYAWDHHHGGGYHAFPAPRIVIVPQVVPYYAYPPVQPYYYAPPQVYQDLCGQFYTQEERYACSVGERVPAPQVTPYPYQYAPPPMLYYHYHPRHRW